MGGFLRRRALVCASTLFTVAASIVGLTPAPAHAATAPLTVNVTASWTLENGLAVYNVKITVTGTAAGQSNIYVFGGHAYITMPAATDFSVGNPPIRDCTGYLNGCGNSGCYMYNPGPVDPPNYREFDCEPNMLALPSTYPKQESLPGHRDIVDTTGRGAQPDFIRVDDEAHRVVYSGGGNDVVDTRAGAYFATEDAQIDAGDGNDLVFVNASCKGYVPSKVTGDAGTDWIMSTGNGSAHLFGGTGSDLLVAGTTSDSYCGLSDKNGYGTVLHGGGGGDTFGSKNGVRDAICKGTGDTISSRDNRANGDPVTDPINPIDAGC